VLTGIVPKMAIRFTSYEWYKQMLADKEGNVNSKSTFMGMLDFKAVECSKTATDNM
jgi:solute carrier family 25 citrate transporter 1